METLVIVGIVLAVLNPVVGGVLVGYIIWRNNPEIGFQIVLLSLTVMSVYIIIFMFWAGKKLVKIDKRLKSLENK